MEKKKKEKVVYAFIDSQNLNLGVRSLGWKLDYGNVDAELVFHSMIEWPNYDQAIIVSGDGDFHCLIEHWETNRKLLKIITPNKKYSSLLRKFAKYILVIEPLKEKLKMQKERHSREE